MKLCCKLYRKEKIMRIFITIFMIFVVLITPVANSQNDPTKSGLAWLIDQQSEDGSFNDNVYDTSFAAIALGLFNEPNDAAMEYLDSYLTSKTQVELDGISIIILAAIANGTDFNSFVDGELEAILIDKLKDHNKQEIVDICVSLIALNAIGKKLPPEIIDRVNLAQQENGAFLDSDNGQADIPVTGLCLSALVLANDNEGVTKAIDFLSQTRNDDGGWGVYPEINSEGFTTTHALLGLQAAGEDLALEWSSSIDYLLSLQDENGGFQIADYDNQKNTGITALALMVVNGYNFLSIADESSNNNAKNNDMDIPDSE